MGAIGDSYSVGSCSSAYKLVRPRLCLGSAMPCECGQLDYPLASH